MPDLIKFEDIGEECKRAKVFGGWLVRVYTEVELEYNHGQNITYEKQITITFVPDPNHEWGEFA